MLYKIVQLTDTGSNGAHGLNVQLVVVMARKVANGVVLNRNMGGKIVTVKARCNERLSISISIAGSEVLK